VIEQARANWITWEQRINLLAAIDAVISARVATYYGHSISPAITAELAKLALDQVEAYLAKPVQVQADTVTITDHRG
jgi:hypothetical protein